MARGRAPSSNVFFFLPFSLLFRSRTQPIGSIREKGEEEDATSMSQYFHNFAYVFLHTIGVPSFFPSILFSQESEAEEDDEEIGEEKNEREEEETRDYDMLQYEQRTLKNELDMGMLSRRNKMKEGRFKSSEWAQNRRSRFGLKFANRRQIACEARLLR